MFTGIIDHCGEVSLIEKQKNSMTIWIKCQFYDLQEGESIAVDGVCLTVITPGTGQFRCDVSPETLRLTTLGQVTKGRVVNLERALRLSDRLGGHVVMGHVDEMGEISQLRQTGDFIEVEVTKLSLLTKPYLIKKGSIAINGTSLTINEVLADGFKIMLIPHTLARTNLSHLREGDKVNIESDWMARVIVQQLQDNYREVSDR